MIFGNPNDTDRSDHLKTMLSLFAQQAPMEMRATGFDAPLFPGHQSHATSILFVDPLEKQELEDYLRHLYVINDDVVRGSLRRKELLEKTRELLGRGRA